MRTTLRRASSRLAGRLADVALPRVLRAPLYGAFARAYGVDLSELRIPLAEHPSFAAFFTRRLAAGARPLPHDPGALACPCDGTLQARDRVERGSVLQAKGRAYPVAELLDNEDAARALEGGHAWTIYLSPRDYHRVHAPLTCELAGVRWLPGELFSVNPRVLARREKVLSINERAVLRLATADGPVWLVMVGALNVGRIRVVGVAAGADVDAPSRFERGDDLARFELGSTVVLLTPPGRFEPVGTLALGGQLRLGQPLATPAPAHGRS